MPDDRHIADKLLAKLTASLVIDRADEIIAARSDLRARIELLRAAQRTGEALSVGREMTAAGCIASAITKLTRELEKLR